jgi:hypothetical protein
MLFALQTLHGLTNPEAHPQLGLVPCRLFAASPHFPALLRRLVELASRCREPQVAHPVSGRCVSELALLCLCRLVATQPHARWLLLAPGFQLQWNRAHSVWEEATGKKILRWILMSVAKSNSPHVSPAVKAEVRQVRARFSPRMRRWLKVAGGGHFCHGPVGLYLDPRGFSNQFARVQWRLRALHPSPLNARQPPALPPKLSRSKLSRSALALSRPN